MRTYLIKVTLRNGTQIKPFYGLYSNGFIAAIAVVEAFPNARRISAMRQL